MKNYSRFVTSCGVHSLHRASGEIRKRVWDFRHQCNFDIICNIEDKGFERRYEIVMD